MLVESRVLLILCHTDSTTTSTATRAYERPKMAESKKIFINQANRQQLESVEVFEKQTIDAILNHRRERGKFGSIEELEKLPGFGEGHLDLIRGRVIVAN
jgi:DNA uptake protein ComE-like DNA-binding protein